MKNNFLILVFLEWLPFAGLSFLLFLVLYASVQQNFRSGANDPQIQMAEDAARTLSAGTDPAVFLNGKNEVDIKQSLSPFIIVYDTAGVPRAGTGRLNGSLPTPPRGVFDSSKWNDLIVGHHFTADTASKENRITWQPEEDVRIASVIVAYTSPSSSGFVLSGRSLREVEERENRLSFMTVLGFLGSLFATLLLVVLKVWYRETFGKHV